MIGRIDVHVACGADHPVAIAHHRGERQCEAVLLQRKRRLHVGRKGVRPRNGSGLLLPERAIACRFRKSRYVGKGERAQNDFIGRERNRLDRQHREPFG